MKFKHICFILCGCSDISLGTSKTLKEAHAGIIVSKMLSEQPGQGSHAEEISSTHTMSCRAQCWACSCALPAGPCSSHSSFVPVGMVSESTQHLPVLFDTQHCAKIPADVERGWWNHRAFQKVPKKLWVSLRKQCNDILIDILLAPHPLYKAVKTCCKNC